MHVSSEVSTSADIMCGWCATKSSIMQAVQPAGTSFHYHNPANITHQAELHFRITYAADLRTTESHAMAVSPRTCDHCVPVEISSRGFERGLVRRRYRDTRVHVDQRHQ